MSQVGALTIEAGAFGGHSDPVGQRNRIAVAPGAHRQGGRLQSGLHLEDRPSEGGWVATIEHQGVEAVQAEVLNKPGGASLLRHRRPLVDAAAVADHDRGHQTAVFGSPPAGHPVAAALLLERPIAEKRHQPLSGERHVDVLQLGEPQVPPFRQPAGCVGVHVAAERGVLRAVLAQTIRVEVPNIAGEPFIRYGVPLRVGLRHVV